EALGLLAHSETEERFLKSQTELHSFIQIAFGGLVAEELFFGEITSGPSSDLKAATTYAAMMVGSLGMAGSFFSYEAIESPHANIVAKVCSDEAGRNKIDELLEHAHDEVKAMLTEHRHVVEGLREVLLEREEL